MEFGGTEVFPDAEFHPTQVSVVFQYQKRPFVFSHKRIELNIYPTKAAKTPYMYQTTTTINSLWEAKNTDGRSG